MHERAVTESLLEIATRHASNAGAKRITDLYLVIGQLSSIIDDSVQFYWDLVAEGTLAHGAALHFKRIPIEMSCLDCNHRYAPEREDFACPACGSSHIKILAGDEFYLEAINIE
jgi:hydrogenase nickel incorporation protein HypA/HybF